MSIERLKVLGLLAAQHMLNAGTAPVLESPDDDDGLWMGHNNPTFNMFASIKFSMRAPLTRLRPGPGRQTFRARVRKQNGSFLLNPFIQAELSENGVSLLNLPSSFVPTANPGIIVAWTWNANVLTRLQGDRVELKLLPGRAGPEALNYTSVDIGSVEWVADTIAQVWRDSDKPETAWREDA